MAILALAALFFATAFVDNLLTFIVIVLDSRLIVIVEDDRAI